MSVIAHIATAVPKNKYSQSQLADYMCETLALADSEKNKLKVMYQRSGISTRYSVLPNIDNQEATLFKTSNTETPTLEARMQVFQQEAPALCAEAIQKCAEGHVELTDITHLITVSCTGMAAPGLDIELIQHLGLRSNTHRTSVNFMGCYAALHALKQAHAICQSEPKAVVMLVCVELCSLHFQQTEDMDNLTANLLFADGAAAALVLPQKTAQDKGLHGFGISQFYSELLFDGKSDMAWRLSSTGFLMTLSSYIPQLVESGVKALVDTSMQGLGYQQNQITHWAIHPGGRKILEAVQRELNLPKEALDSSFEVLKNYGNMSSPTILFVLKAIWENKVDPQQPELTFGLAFGPGLTMESVVLENFAKG
jgi:predicted naringenin-chalcone synthase